MDPSVLVADTYVSNVPAINYICIPNLTLEDDRENIQKGNIIIHET